VSMVLPVELTSKWHLLLTPRLGNLSGTNSEEAALCTNLCFHPGYTVVFSYLRVLFLPGSASVLMMFFLFGVLIKNNGRAQLPSGLVILSVYIIESVCMKGCDWFLYFLLESNFNSRLPDLLFPFHSYAHWFCCAWKLIKN
jgi:hypothetical protein